MIVNVYSISIQYNSLGCENHSIPKKMHVQGNTDATDALMFGSDLFWLCLCPVFLPHLTYKDTVLGSVDQHVKGHKGHDAGQTETARINLHTNLGSDRHHTNAISYSNTPCFSYRQKSFKIPSNSSSDRKFWDSKSERVCV